MTMTVFTPKAMTGEADLLTQKINGKTIDQTQKSQLFVSFVPTLSHGPPEALLPELVELPRRREH
jgi:hypothetical protein